MIRYPYISCEVFCCEVQDILQTLVESEDNKLLKKLFSLLDSKLPLNPHLGGYFEKILEMLFRRMTVPVIPFVNQGGINLLRRFLDQIDNYSVMQIVQRLMLPHIPFLMTIDPNDMMMDDRQNYQCNWASIPEACDMLCNRMLDLQHVDVPSHVSDLLITVLQLSPPDASILYHLCNPDCLKKLFTAAFACNADHESVESPPSAVASVSLAALSVLESLVSRICEAMVPPGIDNSYMIDDSNTSANSTGTSDAAEREIIERDIDIHILSQLKASITNICAALSPHLPTVHKQLQSYLISSPCGRVATQTKSSLPRLGHRGLLMVKLIESTIRLGDSDIDKLLCDTGVLSSSVELIFAFKFNSLLHLTVQRIVLMVVEGGAVRRYVHLCHSDLIHECHLTVLHIFSPRNVQHSLLFEFGFLHRLMLELRSNSEATPSEIKPDVNTAAEIGKVDLKAKDREDERNLLAGSRCPLLGHLVQIAQVIATLIGSMR
jgi:serine/threonine-protein phosphatase 6 regulatory subunit 3